VPAYLIASYDITDEDEYAKYNPGSIDLIMKTVGRHGGKVLAAGPDNDWFAGERAMIVLMEFPSREAANAWENDPDYRPAKEIRVGSTGNRFEAIAPEFVPPAD